jgi:hypothetical protein
MPFNIIKKNPTAGEVTSSLTNASDSAGLHFDGAGYVNLTNAAGAEFGTSDFSLEFIIDQDGDNTGDNYIFYSHLSGNSRIYVYNDISADEVILTFVNSSGSSANYTLAYDMAADYGTPTHYVLSADRSSNLVLYKNGNSVASVSIAASSTVDIGALNTAVGVIGSQASGYSVLGTFYRFRTWNKSLTAAEVTATYENATVPFADQWGSQTEMMANNNFSSGDTGWNKNAGWTIVDQGGGDYEAVATSVINGNVIYQTPAALTAGKKYRLTYTVTAISSGGFNWRSGDTNDIATTRTTVGTYTEELTITDDDGDVIGVEAVGTTTGRIDDVSVVEIGCVADYDLAFANPTQSDQVQDRSTNLADGTASAGVTQVTKIEAVNTNKLNVGGTTPLVGIGLAAGVTPDAPLTVVGAVSIGYPAAAQTDGSLVGQFDFTGKSSDETPVVARIKSEGTATAGSGKNCPADLTFWTQPAGGADLTKRLTIDSAGNVGIGVSPTSFDSEGNNLVVGSGSGDEGLTIYTGSSAGHHGSIFFADGTTGTATKKGQIRYEQNNEIMSFYTNAAERLTIDSTGLAVTGEVTATGKVEIQDTVGLAFKAKRTSTGAAGGLGAGANSQGLAIFSTDHYADTPIVFGINQLDSSANPFQNLDEKARISSTGLAVTGAISSTGDMLISTASSPALSVTSTGSTVTNKVMADDSSGYLGTSTNHPLAVRTNNVDRVIISSAGLATFANGVEINGSAGLNIDQSAANGSVQHLSGSTTCADNVMTEVAFVSHSNLFTVQAFAWVANDKNGGAKFDFGTSFGSGTVTRTFHHTSTEVTDISCDYQNTGGSTSYLLRIKVDLATAASCTVRWTISGHSIETIYAI